MMKFTTEMEGNIFLGDAENAVYQHFLLYQQCFNSLPQNTEINRPLNTEVFFFFFFFKNIVEKGENAGNQHFLLFPQCFLPFQRQKSPFTKIKCVVCKCFEFDQGQNVLVW